MLTWGQVILKLLTLVEWMVRLGQEHKWIKEGEDREIARQNAEIFRKTEFANATHDMVRDLPDDKLNDLLRSLGRSAEAQRGGQLLHDVQAGDLEREGRVDQSIQGSAGKDGDKRG